MQGCNDGGDGLRPTGSQVVAAGLGDLLDQAVSPYQEQFPGDSVGLAALFNGGKLPVRSIKELHQVTVAEAVGHTWMVRGNQVCSRALINPHWG